MNDQDRFSNLTYEDFRVLAREEGLSKYQRIGFPNSYREGTEEAIFADIRSKLTVLEKNCARIADIGPGCSDLPRMMINLCREKGHNLTLLDSEEMLKIIPDEHFIVKYPTRFPACLDWISENEGKLNAILCYSVLHYVFSDGSIYGFLDAALSLLAPHGQLLIGDIPNISRRKRFFSSKTGTDYHKKFMNTHDAPLVEFNRIEPNSIDDAILFSMVLRARTQGFDAYIVPQAPNLPMANRREDLLIIRP